jgi:hypothetical protein
MSGEGAAKEAGVEVAGVAQTLSANARDATVDVAAALACMSIGTGAR